MSKLILFGKIGVDSGQLIITDPCNLEQFICDDMGDSKGNNYSYSGCCNASLSKQRYGQIKNQLAVCFSTFSGDGVFSVYGEINSKGWLTKVIIDLTR